MDEPIFDFKDNYKYIGVLSAIAAQKEVMTQGNDFFELPKGYVAEIIGFVWINDKGEWNAKARIKFPSGNKLSYGKNLGKNSNEDACLKEMAKFPMDDIYWFPTPTGDLKDLIDLMVENDLIDSMEMREIKQ